MVWHFFLSFRCDQLPKVPLADTGLVRKFRCQEKDNLKRKSRLSLQVKSAHSNTQTEVDETLKRIQSHKGVLGIIILNVDGVPIKSTMDNATTVQYAGLITQLADKARRTIKDIDSTNDLTFLRVRSKKHEIMIAPDKEYLLIVIQNPSE